MNLFDQVTRTKILLPRRRPDLLSRQRLLDLLFDLLDHRLIIIAAPAGYGKTSLLVDMAHRIELPVCWYALDALDRDAQRFAAHFIASIAQRFPRFGQRSWSALQNGLVDPADMDRLVTTIVNEAYDHIREHFVLVLDDYHFVNDNDAIDYFVNQFVQQVDENCHLCIASRTLLTLPDLPLMVARSQVGGLSFEELAFRTDEIQALVLQNHHITLPDSAAEELAKETEGWITGLLLSTQTMWHGAGDRARVARVSGVGLYDYLAQQVLEQQPAPVRSFLLRTSMMEEFDVQLCEKVLGQADSAKGESWQSLVEYVLQYSLFVLPVENEGTWLRYHHLFRDFLQEKLAKEQPEEQNRILRRLAVVYTEEGKWEKAHALYQRLEDQAATTALIEQAGSSLIRDGRLATLAGWLDLVPSDLLASRPILLSLRGMVASMLGEVEQGLELQNQAESAFRERGDLAGLAHTLVSRATDHRFLGDYHASLRDAEEALSIARENPNLRGVEAEALRARGLGLARMGKSREAIEWLGQSLDVYTSLTDAQRVAMLRMELGTIYSSAGMYNQAFTHYKRALNYWRKTGNGVQQANLLNNLGVLHHLNGDYEQANLLLEQALACAAQSGYTRMEVAALASIGDLYMDMEAIDAAQAVYQKAHEKAQYLDDRFLRFYLHLADAAAARARDEKDSVRDLLEAAGRVAAQSESSFEQGLYQLEAGRLALAEGNAVEAIAHLEGAARRFDDGGQRVEGARAHLYLAIAYHQAEDQQAAADHFERAFQLASELESQHSLLVPAREGKSLLSSLRKNPRLGQHAAQLFKQVIEFEQGIPSLRRRLRPRVSSVPFDSPSLQIQAFGRAQVMLNGRLVTTSDWQTQSSRDLFFCLLAHPGGLSKEEVGSLVWPDSSPAQLKLKFKNTIYRLRQALTPEAVLFEEDRYRFNRELDYEYDVESFLNRLKEAEAAQEPAEKAAAYRTAVRLYKGPYLPDVEGEWAWWERERFGRAYIDTILKLAEFHLVAQEYHKSLDYSQRVLAEDPYLEEAHRLAMRAYAAMGNRAGVARQFERCRQILMEEINAPPSPQTTDLYQTLMH
jgi:ATP/maltotriose-dependent transcriptional regulator MalT/DNA-binding SARP family transcriptional activator